MQKSGHFQGNRLLSQSFQSSFKTHETVVNQDGTISTPDGRQFRVRVHLANSPNELSLNLGQLKKVAKSVRNIMGDSLTLSGKDEIILNLEERGSPRSVFALAEKKRASAKKTPSGGFRIESLRFDDPRRTHSALHSASVLLKIHSNKIAKMLRDFPSKDFSHIGKRFILELEAAQQVHEELSEDIDNISDTNEEFLNSLNFKISDLKKKLKEVKKNFIENSTSSCEKSLRETISQEMIIQENIKNGLKLCLSAYERKEIKEKNKKLIYRYQRRIEYFQSKFEFDSLTQKEKDNLRVLTHILLPKFNRKALRDISIALPPPLLQGEYLRLAAMTNVIELNILNEKIESQVAFKNYLDFYNNLKTIQKEIIELNQNMNSSKIKSISIDIRLIESELNLLREDYLKKQGTDGISKFLKKQKDLDAIFQEARLIYTDLEKMENNIAKGDILEKLNVLFLEEDLKDIKEWNLEEINKYQGLIVQIRKLHGQALNKK